MAYGYFTAPDGTQVYGDAQDFGSTDLAKQYLGDYNIQVINPENPYESKAFSIQGYNDLYLQPGVETKGFVGDAYQQNYQPTSPQWANLISPVIRDTPVANPTTNIIPTNTPSVFNTVSLPTPTAPSTPVNTPASSPLAGINPFDNVPWSGAQKIQDFFTPSVFGIPSFGVLPTAGQVGTAATGITMTMLLLMLMMNERRD